MSADGFSAGPPPGAAADWTIDQAWDGYTPEEHRVWDVLYERQSALLPGRACDEFLKGLDSLDLHRGGIPDFARINEELMRLTGWTVVAVPGLVPDDVFFEHLANRRFPAGQFIRKPDQLDYLQEPDVFHDVFGHVPLLMQPRYADYMAEYGRAGLHLAGQPALANLARLYWYTVEFGLMHTPAGLRIFGAGIISSAGETVYSLESPVPARVRFDTARVLRTLYKIDDFQRIYFVLSGYRDLPALTSGELDRLIAAVRDQHDIAPGEIIDADRIVSARGDVH
jgi:phenylalanine-4-hydroxylase